MDHWFIGGLFISGHEQALESFKKQHFIEHHGRLLLNFEGAVPVPAVFQTICYEAIVIEGRHYEAYHCDPDGAKTGVSEEEMRELAREYGTWDLKEWAFYNWGSCSQPVMHKVDEQALDEDGHRKLNVMFGVPESFPHAWLGRVMDMHYDLCFEGFFSHAQMRLEIYIQEGVVTYQPLAQECEPTAGSH